MKKNKKILITGGAGFVGTNLIKLLLKKTQYEISLFRLEQCAKQAKLGVSFVAGSPSAVTCQDIVITVPPNQVLPHKHIIKK